MSRINTNIQAQQEDSHAPKTADLSDDELEPVADETSYLGPSSSRGLRDRRRRVPDALGDAGNRTGRDCLTHNDHHGSGTGSRIRGGRQPAARRQEVPPDGGPLEDQPGRPGGRTGADPAQPRRRLVGWSGVPDSDEDPEVEGLDLVSVPLSIPRSRDYYEGFSNGTLWPYHDVIAAGVRPRVVERLRRRQREVRRGHRARCRRGRTVWVQDYQLQLSRGCCGKCDPT